MAGQGGGKTLGKDIMQAIADDEGSQKLLEASELMRRTRRFCRYATWTRCKSQSGFATACQGLYLMNSELGQPNLEQMTLNFFFADGGSGLVLRALYSTGV